MKKIRETNGIWNKTFEQQQIDTETNTLNAKTNGELKVWNIYSIAKDANRRKIIK